jgi:tryptophan synthase alpha chain
MELSKYLRTELEKKPLLLMTHIVIGYPDLETSYALVDAMVEAGVEIMELQIPFSEPVADGPVILHANQRALETGIKVEQCFEFARNVAAKHKIPFLFMSYYNVLFKRGLGRFVDQAKAAGIQGAIVPDCPPEEGEEYLAEMKRGGLAPVFIYSPNTSDARLKKLGELSGGFVYVVLRKGVTGSDTVFSEDMTNYLKRCRAATDLPLAVGFGVKDRSDVDFLKGKADIAVVGSQSLRTLETEGVAGVKKFLTSLRSA